MTAKLSASADGTKVLLGTAAEDALQIDVTAKTVSPVTPYSFSGNSPSFVVGQVTLTNFPDGVQTKVLFGSIVRSVGNAYDPGESRFIAPKTGMYAFSWAVGQGSDVTANGDAMFGASLAKNGAVAQPVAQASPISLNNSFRPTCAGSAVVLLNTGDYVEVFGVALGIPTTPMVSTYLGYFTGQFLGN